MIRALVLRDLRAQRWVWVGVFAVGSVIMWFDVWIRVMGEYRNASLEAEYVFLRGYTLGMLFLASMSGGIGVGISLFRSDTQHGLEPFLLHLPISRPCVFFARFVAGGVLLSTALLSPFLLRAIWTSLGYDRIGPFAWEMTYPGIACIATSIGYLGAGLWIGAGRRGETVLGVLSVVAASLLFVPYAWGGMPPIAEAKLLGGTAVLYLGGLVAYLRREI